MKDISDLDDAIIIDLTTGYVLGSNDAVLVRLSNVPSDIVVWLDTLNQDEMIAFGQEFGDSMFADLDCLTI